MNLVPYAHPVLTKPATLVGDPRMFADSIPRMQKLMREHKGVGLAAPSVGIPARFFVSTYEKWPVVINPLWVPVGNARTSKLEGSLNRPNFHVYVPAYEKIRATWIDQERKPHEADLEGMEARVFQHLCNQLDGSPIWSRN